MESDRPSITNSEAVLLMQEHYGMDITNIKQLKSHEARNFLVTDQVTKASYVLKFVKQDISLENLELQFECMRHLNQNGFTCSLPIENIHGDTVFEYITESCHCKVYLLSYIPGKDARDFIESSDVLFDIGRMIFELQKCFQEFGPKIQRELLCNNWSTETIPDLENCLSELDNEHQRELVVKALKIFTQRKDCITQLVKGWIHGDIHDENVIVIKDGQMKNKNEGETNAAMQYEDKTVVCKIERDDQKDTENKYDRVDEERKLDLKGNSQTTQNEPSPSTTFPIGTSTTSILALKQRYGILDFEDIHKDYFIMELVIPMAVFMMSIPSDPKRKFHPTSEASGTAKFPATSDIAIDLPTSDTIIPKFLKTSGHILAGYVSKQSLTSNEKSALYPLILACYAQELVLCSMQKNQQTEANAYLTEIFPNAWPQLEFLLQCGEDYVWDVWNGILEQKGLETII